jgi:hypothetical protein
MNVRIVTLACALVAALALPAHAQDYPTQTIKIISSFGAGGGSDIIARILAQRMQEKLGQNVIVENRPGAGGVLGNEVVANSPKDGYTLGVQTAGQIIASVITKNMRYDAVGAFDWIGQIATAGLFIVVRPTPTSSRWSPPPRPIRARSCSAARDSPPPSISPANCSSSAPASTCCTCPTARHRRCSPPSWQRTSTW